MNNVKDGFEIGGWATVYNIKCTDGRIIAPGAFKHMDGIKVPLVWQHGHNDVTNILGHVLLEERQEGMYLYGSFNDSLAATQAKQAVIHGDINAFSIYANGLTETGLSGGKKVTHGFIREVSLVLAGANPGAVIDFVALQHNDGSISVVDDEAIIYTGMTFDYKEGEEMTQTDNTTNTVQAVFDTLNDQQKELFYAMAANLVLGPEGEEGEEDQLEQGDIRGMKRNIFEGDSDVNEVIGLDFSAVKSDAMRTGSLKSAILQHAETYGIGSDRENLEILFPDARATSDTPTWISRRMEWVAGVLRGTKHVPYSRVKTVHADITADEARAKGYITGDQKISEVFPLLKRSTTPTTIYKLQKMDRDDILDISDFDVVRWLKGEMRTMLDEEIARAILIGDGRLIDAPDKINPENLRPIWGDNPLYVHYVAMPAEAEADDYIDYIIGSRVDYRGSGGTTCYVPPSILTTWLLMRDSDGRRLYRTKSEIAAELGVSQIEEVPAMENLTRLNDDEDTVELKAIIVNLQDYTIGADKGGEVGFFDDFDIDFNKYTYLMEARISGAMTVPKGAIVLEQLQEGN